MKNATPFDLWRGGFDFGCLMVETQMVMTYRLMGMAGLWAVAPSEDRLMWSEKGPAFTTALLGAASAAMAGKRPDEIVGAAVRPLRRKTRSNAARLGRRGPRLP